MEPGERHPFYLKVAARKTKLTKSHESGKGVAGVGTSQGACDGSHLNLTVTVPYDK